MTMKGAKDSLTARDTEPRHEEACPPQENLRNLPHRQRKLSPGHQSWRKRETEELAVTSQPKDHAVLEEADRLVLTKRMADFSVWGYKCFAYALSHGL
ncbi:unnamed protein product [Caretta caretta]